MTREISSIAAGLALARAPRPIPAGERIHVVGIAGAGASAAALLACRAGADVTGCDPGGASQYTEPLLEAGIAIDWRHDPAHVTSTPHPDRLAVTKALTAVDPDHPELAVARAIGVPVETWQQVVADTACGRRLVGIAGTHGKSTSSGWLVHVLTAAGADPCAFVGALMPATVTGGLPATSRWGSGDAFVVEADEYAGNFDSYRPAVIVLTSAEWDHPDVFADRAAVLATFERWIRAAAELWDAAERRPSEVDPPGAAETAPTGPPVLVANVGDAGVAEIAARLGDWPGRIVAQ